jgi:tetratricopeptide (TPR) repeat protein
VSGQRALFLGALWTIAVRHLLLWGAKMDLRAPQILGGFFLAGAWDLPTRFLNASIVLVVLSTATAANPITDCNSNDLKLRLEGCSALLEASLRKAERALAHSRRSDAHLAAGHLAAAIVDRIQAIDLEPENTNYARRLSDLYILRAQTENNDEEREKSVALAHRVDPTNHAVHFARAVEHVNAKKLDTAIADLKRASELAPGEQRYVSLLSKLLGLRGSSETYHADYDAAIADLNDALRLDANNVELLITRGRALNGKKSSEDALADLSRAITLEPEKVEAHFLRAEIFYSQQRFQETLDELIEILKRDSKHIDALMLRGLVYEAIDKTDDAGRDYRAILRLQSTHKLAKAGLERLQPAPKSPPTSPQDEPDLMERTVRLQRELKRVGCYSSAIDGRWGASTKTALREFAEKSGISFPENTRVETVIAAVARRRGTVCWR